MLFAPTESFENDFSRLANCALNVSPCGSAGVCFRKNKLGIIVIVAAASTVGVDGVETVNIFFFAMQYKGRVAVSGS